MRYLRLGVLTVATVGIVSCSPPSRLTETSAVEPSPEARLQQIPPADPQKYAGMRDMKEWRNPYLIVQANGVALLDAANHEEHLLKPQELPEALAKLPLSAWPYGRVVVVTENVVRATGDDALIRKNRGIIAGTLENLHILIHWVPSA